MAILGGLMGFGEGEGIERWWDWLRGLVGGSCCLLNVPDAGLLVGVRFRGWEVEDEAGYLG